MPEFVAYIGAELMMSGIAEAAGAFLLSNAAIIATSAMLLGSAAMSASAKRKAKAQYNASQVDRLVNVGGTTSPRELVMGRVRKGGTVFFKGSTDTNNTKFVMAIALASHEIDAVETIYLNDIPVALDGAGYVTTAPYRMTHLVSTAETFTGNTIVLAHSPVDADHVSVVTGGGGDGTSAIAFTLSGSTVTTDAGWSSATKTVQYQYSDTPSKARIRSYLGSPSQTADATLISLFPALWTSAHRARGVAYLICEFDYDEVAFPSGLPTVTAVIRGAKIYDPRTGTTAWTENPALMARHLLLHPQFGKRTSITAAEDTRITAAANACDVSTVYTVAGVAQTARALYKAAIVIPFGTTARDALDDVVQAMAGQWAYAAGAFFVRAGAYTATVQTLTDADLAVVQRSPDGSTSQRPIQIITHRARDQMINVVTPTIWDASQDYKQTALTPLKSATLIARDGAELVQDLSLPAVGYAPQALHIAGVLLRDARDPLTVTLPFKLTAYRIELFDTVSLTLSRYGWSAKTFMVMSREWTHDGSISLTLKENTASTYTLDASFSAQGGADNTALPSPWLVPDITGLVVTSGQTESVPQPDGTQITGMRIAWTALTAPAITQGGTVELQWRAADSTGTWSSASASGSDTSIAIMGLTSGVHYIVRARARSAVAVGLWSASVLHQAWGVGLQIAVFREHIEGWPGTKSQGQVVAGNVLEADSFASQQWSGRGAWSGLTAWRTSPYNSVAYLSLVRDLGAPVTFSLQTTVDLDGTVYQLQMHGSTVSAADVLTQPWVDASQTMTARWLQINIVCAPTAAAPMITLRALEYAVRAAITRQFFQDLSIATLTGSNRITAGDVVLPTYRTFQRITFVSVTILDARQGVWSWSLLGRDTARIQIRLDGVLTDPASIDATIEGY